MNAKHTPGPWTLNPTGGQPIVGFDCGDGGALLPLVHSVHGFDEKVAMANARLIAAAPELLDACQMVSDGPHDAEAIADMLPAIRAAIAKATVH